MSREHQIELFLAVSAVAAFALLSFAHYLSGGNGKWWL